MVMMVVALPLQGQAAALMTCHSLKTLHEPSSVGPHVSAAADHEQHHGKLGQDTQHIEHGQADNPHLAFQAGQVHTEGTGASSCALCSAFCTMAVGLSQAGAQHTLEFRPPSLPQTTASVYVGVVLDGLLRPPRA